MSGIKWEYDNEILVYIPATNKLHIKTDEYSLIFTFNSIVPKVSVSETFSNTNEEHIQMFDIVGKTTPTNRLTLHIEINNYENTTDDQTAILMYTINDTTLLSFNIYNWTAKKIFEIAKAIETNSPLPAGEQV